MASQVSLPPLIQLAKILQIHGLLDKQVHLAADTQRHTLLVTSQLLLQTHQGSLSHAVH